MMCEPVSSVIKYTDVMSVAFSYSTLRQKVQIITDDDKIVYKSISERLTEMYPEYDVFIESRSYTNFTKDTNWCVCVVSYYVVDKEKNKK